LAGAAAAVLVVAVLAGAVVVAAGAAAVVTVLVIAGGGAPVPLARLTSAAARTPSESRTSTAIALVRPFHLGEAARRVRAAAPQRRHHS
jgi:hypothetical protein